jgi:hypothetical protein
MPTFSTSASYWDMSFLEFTGGCLLGPSSSLAYGDADYINIGTGTNLTIHDNYFHGWVHGPCNQTGGTCAGTGDNFTIVNGSTATPTQNTNASFYNNVMDGSDSTNGGDSGAAIIGSPNVFTKTTLEI